MSGLGGGNSGLYGGNSGLYGGNAGLYGGASGLINGGGSGPVVPVLTNPTDATLSPTSASLSVDTDTGDGTLYWFVSTSAVAPSAADLKAGTGAADFGDQAVVAIGTQVASATGLAQGTQYYTYFIQTSAALVDSNIAAADGFVTTRELLAGNRMGSPSFSNATSPPAGGAFGAAGGITFRDIMACAPSSGGYTNIKVMYGANLEVLAGTTVLGNTLSVKFAFEQSGAFYTVSKSGNRTWTIADGGVEISDAASGGFALASGSTFYGRAYLTVPMGGRLPLGLGIANTGDFYRRNGVVTGTPTAGADIVDATGITGFGAQGASPQPLAVIGTTSDLTVKAVSIVGNSIGAGEGDGVGDANAYRGYVERQLAGNVNWSQGSRGSGHLFDLITSGAANIAAVLDYCTSCIECRWLNDIYISGRTTAQVQQAIIDWALFAKTQNPNVACFTVTSTPQTTGTYTSTLTQTINNTTRNTQRINTNDWIRGGAPINGSNVPVAVGTPGAVVMGDPTHPIHDYFEIADLVEADITGALVRNGSLWYCGPANNTAYTNDGNHPNPLGAATMAPGIVLANLV